jgi:tetratricopeptide (TPR) repeat protein
MRCAIALMLGVLLSGASTARAEPRPWQVGVTEEQKAIAQRWLDQGNDLFVQNSYKEALAAYEQGLAAWAHPAIRFNVARTLIALDRPLEALTALEAAMAFGAEPLADVWSEARNYRGLLERQIATLTVRCDQPGVAVTLDGEALPACPSATARRVLPGRHVIVARQAGSLTVTREVTLIGGQADQVALHLIALRDAAVTRTRWPTWKPWAVVGGGAAVAGLGVAVELAARSTMDDYRAALAQECGERGCAGGATSAGTASLARQAELRDGLGVSLMAVGGVTLVAGAVLLIANRPYTDVPDEARTALVPLVTGDAVGLALVGRR